MSSVHPASLVSQAEVMGYLEFSDDQIDYLLDHEVSLSVALLTNDEYSVQVLTQGYQISIGATRLRKVDDNGYTDIDELEDGLYRLSFEEHIKF